MTRDSDSSRENDLLLQVEDSVRCFLASTFSGSDLAEEASSRCILSLARRFRGGFRPEEPVPYALRAAWHAALDVLREEERRPSAIEPAQEPVDACAGHQFADLKEWIAVAMGRLRPRHRAVLHLRYERDLDLATMSDILGRPLGTVGRWLHEARAAMRRELRRTGGGEPALSVVLGLIPEVLCETRRTAPAAGAAAGSGSLQFLVWGLTMAKSTKLIIAGGLLLVIGVIASWRALDMLWQPHGNPGRPAPDAAKAVEPEIRRTDTDDVATVPFADEDAAVSGISGVVVDHAGKPVKGVAVTVRPASPAGSRILSAPWAMGDDDVMVRSAADGSFTIHPGGEARLLDVIGSAEDRGFGLVERVGIGREGVRLVLQAVFDLEGRVQTLDLSPLGGARLMFEARLGGHLVRRTTVARDDGSFVMHILPASASMPILQAQADGFATQCRVFNPRLWGVDGGRARHREFFFLAREARLEGSVSSAATGEPLKGVLVRAWEGEGGWWNGSGRRLLSTTRTDARGRYRLAGLPVEVEHIEVVNTFVTRGCRASGWLEFRAEDHATVWRPLLAPREESARMREDVAMPVPTLVRGRVLDPRGLAVAGVAVTVFVLDDSAFADPFLARFDRSFQARTDAQGRYAFSPVPSGGGRTVKLRLGILDRTGLHPAVSVEGRAGEDLDAPDLVFRATGRGSFVWGVVRDSSGRPVSGASVKIGFEERFTDASGSFRVPMTEPASLSQPHDTWHVEAMGFRALQGKLTDDLPGRSPVTFTLEPSRGPPLEGVVLDAMARPVPGAVVRVLDAKQPLSVADRSRGGWGLERVGQIAWAKTNASGRFRIPDLEFPRVHLVVRHPAEHGKRDRPPDAQVENMLIDGSEAILTLTDYEEERLGTILVHVLDARTQLPLRNRVIASISRDGKHLQGWRAYGPGLVRFLHVRPGEYTVAARAKGHLEARGIPAVVPVQGGTVEVTALLKEGFKITGKVIHPVGSAPTAELRIHVRPRDATGGERFVKPGPDGRFVIDGLHSGTWIISATGGRNTSLVSESEQHVALDAEHPEETCTLRLVPGGIIRVLVASPAFEAADLKRRTGAFSTTAKQAEEARSLARRMVVRVRDSGGQDVTSGMAGQGNASTWFSPERRFALPDRRYFVIVERDGQEVYRGTHRPPCNVTVSKAW